METARFDLVVVGGGAAGLYAASAANTLGAKTCLIEKHRLGGDCTWFGCMPSKAILKSASVAQLLRRLREFGLGTREEFKLETSAVMSSVSDVVNRISQHHPPELFEKRGIRVVFGAPRFVSGAELEIEGARMAKSAPGGDGTSPGALKVSASRFVIATGSRPLIPPVDGLEKGDYLTNENIFQMDRLPDSLVVLGAGPIGVELAQALNRLGVKIQLVEMLDRILFREDRQAAELMAGKLRAEGVEILTGCRAVKFAREGNAVSVTVRGRDGKEQQLPAENVLVAVGRIPAVQGLDLDKAGVEHTKQGIKVNRFLQTTNRNIFACGDVVGPYLFSHMAAYQAQVCVRNALFRRIVWQKARYENVPWAIFTEPELAHLGLTEEEAREKHGTIQVYASSYNAADRAVTNREEEGLVKVITDTRCRIIGAHVVGAQASEIIQGLVIAKWLGLPFSKLAGPIFIYPTLSELLKKTAGKPLLAKLESPLTRNLLKVLKAV